MSVNKTLSLVAAAAAAVFGVFAGSATAGRSESIDPHLAASAEPCILNAAPGHICTTDSRSWQCNQIWYGQCIWTPPPSRVDSVV
ncbi:hypothetical protein [Actinoplanes philippinensis]|uniref:hypothetical protein n=1 Tax=Actinoplanes philippinensis TaxID=35752 RepID=UPI0033E6C85A